jgi:hypothetical protein
MMKPSAGQIVPTKFRENYVRGESRERSPHQRRGKHPLKLITLEPNLQLMRESGRAQHKKPRSVRDSTKSNSPKKKRNLEPQAVAGVGEGEELSSPRLSGSDEEETKIQLWTRAVRLPRTR